MENETHDQIGYRIAVAAIGTALIVVLAGLCVIVAVGEGAKIPKEMWSTVSALGGGLLGLLAPSPTAPTPTPEEKAKIERGEQGTAPGLGKTMSANRSVVILLVIFAAAVILGGFTDATQFQALAAASGAALIGLLAPSQRINALRLVRGSHFPAGSLRKGRWSRVV